MYLRLMTSGKLLDEFEYYYSYFTFDGFTPMKNGKGGVPRFGKMREIRNYE